MNKILVVEDDATIVEGLVNALHFHGFAVTVAENSNRGFACFQADKPDLIILDITLPGIDGYELCRKIRSQDQQIPIVMLTARSQESDKLLGFELGADDYITKPFSAQELIARLRAVLKRVAPTREQSAVLKVGQAQIDFDQFLVRRQGREMSLSPKELKILRMLVNHAEAVISRERIIDEVWGDEYLPSPKTIDNFIVKLRNKIEEDPKIPRHILTIHGAGYKFKF